MTNAELLDLLREARDELNNWYGADDLLLARMNAALAERQDSETEVHPCMADWHRDIRESERSKAQRALFEGAGLEVFFGGHVWHWRTNLGGTCDSEDEAKSAAIAAARGHSSD